MINKLLEPVIAMLPGFLRCIISEFLELTNGAFTITHTTQNTKTMLVLLSAGLGWSGMSVHMQVKNIILDTDLSMKKYYITRLLSCVISTVISLAVFENKECLSGIPKDSFSYEFMIIISVAVIIFAVTADHKKHTKKASR